MAREVSCEDDSHRNKPTQDTQENAGDSDGDCDNPLDNDDISRGNDGNEE